MNEFTGLEIAIVGMAGRFPGADTIDDYWDLVASGREAISTFSDEEVERAGVPAEIRGRPDYVPAAGVLSGAEYFDPGFFGLSPRDAAVLDPQQRVFLECAWHALEDAGYAERPERHLVGVYAGTSFSTYLLRNLLPNAQLMRDLSEHELMLCNEKDTLATHAAYHLNLTGPAITVQTACSTSLVAVHLACQGLLAGDCDLALAGGASVQFPQTEGYLFQEGGIMSPDGHCRPFDARAQGTLVGGGAGLVVLKRLADAVRDRDTVHAVIKGTAINNDGSSKVGFTAPSVSGQAAVIRAALGAAEVDPATIGYVEAHGTGTRLGDPIEVAALTEAYRDSTRRQGYCAIGSVKALIGHTDTAAGVAGLLKAVLAVREGTLPPSPYFTEPNLALGLESSPFYVNREPESWPADLLPRRAAISSFGMGSTNAHAIVQEPPAAPPAEPDQRTGELLLLSARTPEALSESRERLREYLAGHPAVSLADVGHTLRVGRRAFTHRMAVTCSDRAQALARLTAEPVEGRWTGAAGTERREVVFLFPGQGSQHPGMAMGLHEREPEFRRHLDECAALLRPHLDADLLDVIRAPQDRSALGQTRYTQPALFAVEYALARWWQERGVRPVTMLGHSVGEYVAACLAGVIDLPDALALVAVRGRLVQGLPAGSMLAVHQPIAQITERLYGGLGLAAGNAPGLSVISGPDEDVDRLERELTGEGVQCRRLHTSHAFHSSMMEPILDDFAKEVARVRLRPAAIPFVSGVTGEPVTAEEVTDPNYWVSQLRQPVRFSEGLGSITSEHGRVLLEVGPGTTLTTLARQHDLAASGHIALSSLGHPRTRQPDGEAVAAAFGRMWVAGADVDRAAYAAPARRVPLPGYPFERRRCWYDPPSAPSIQSGTVGDGTDQVTPVEPAAAAAPHGGETEELIREVWRQLLGVPEVAPHDNFFELGGHSLSAIQVIARLREGLGVDLPAGALFEAPTVGTLAGYVEELRAAANGGEVSDGDLLAETGGLSAEELKAELAWIRADKERERS
ncbi:type I polyketide synthase [Streptosporangium sp. KLBMP 9127]|nr:acyltransferase domain-containing protein [Streptosporangium sp. KLBMP 9127]